MPANVKIASIPPRNSPNVLVSVGVRKNAVNTVAAVMPMPATSDHTAPPNRSHRDPRRPG